MDHNGLYTDLDSFASITNCSTNNNSFNDTSTLPSLNNFKYQQTNLSTNIYQQPVQSLHDLSQQQQQHNHTSTKSSSNTLPQTQININNCNNNIFFPHDDGIFDANTTSACASASNSGNNNHISSNNQSQKNNFNGYVRKELGTIGGGGGGGGGGDNITYNINNINTNIVNNINNPTSLNGSDIFGGNQYHQINKNGETIINFTNNNLNSTGTASMPSDTVSATSQNYYGYQSNNGQGQQTVYESSVQSQSQSSSYLDPVLSASTKSGSSMGTSGVGHYHGHHQTMTNGSFLPGNANTIPSEHTATSVDPFSEYPETLSTAKIINNFESKNPLKYPTANRAATGTYYKAPNEYPTHQYHPSSHLPPHGYSSMYQPSSGPTVPKIQPTHGYDPYSRASRNPAQHYTMQHYGNPANSHSMEDHAGNRLGYSRTSSVPVHASYHHPHTLPHPPPPPSNYGNYYANGYSAMPYPAYPQMQPTPYGSPMMRSESCTKASSNYNKTGAVATHSPVEHSSYSMPHGPNYPTPKKDFYNESHYYPQPPHPYYDDSMNNALNSCAKKASSRSKVTGDIYNPNGATTMYPDHHTMVAHHPQNGNMMRSVNVGYQPMPKHYAGGSSYPMPTSSCDLTNPYHNFNYHFKNGEHPKMPSKINPAISSKQFKSYGHFEPLPHPHVSYGHPQYHTMQAKHPEKIKISIDLEEQINSSKIPKLRDAPHPSYGFDPHHPHLYYQYHHHIPSRSVVNDNDPKNSIANINISLRDFLSTWNDEEDEAGGGERRAVGNGALEDLSEHMERTIMREYNPMFVQKATDSFISASDVPSTSGGKSQLSDLETGIINEGTEKLYVLESIDVPLSELNKYKHLSVINKLPENVVINDKEFGDVDDSSMKFIEEIDLAREKLYKSEFELEFEACQERKLNKPIDEPEVAQVDKVVIDEIVAVDKLKIEDEEKTSDEASTKRKSLKAKTPKLKSEESKVPKVLKLKKEKILKVSSSKDPRKARLTKRVKKYSLNQRTSSVKSLQSICVDFLNTSGYRNYAREQLSIINKFSKMRVLKDFKKKFNFGAKKPNPVINQKLNHSVGINSLREICGNLLKDKSRMLEINNEDDEDESMRSENENIFPTLKQLSRQVLSEMDIDVVENEYLYTPLSLKELCETFIYSHNQYFLIEEVSNVPKLQDLCKNVLSETNIFINLDEVTLNDEPEEALESSPDEPIYFVEENSSNNVGELFESENLNSFEKSEILRKIQRVANIEDDDEIIRAIGALHHSDDDVESINNNNSNVSNRNISCANENFPEANEFSMTNEVMKFDSELSFLSYMDDDLMHSVQYEEIISLNDEDGKVSRKVVEILRHKYLNRSDVRQASRTIQSILRKSLTYQRVKRFHNAKRCEQINVLKQQARAAISKWKKSNDCDNSNSDGKSSSERSSSSLSSQQESDKESQNYAKDDTKAQAQSHQKLLNPEPTIINKDSTAGELCFDAQAEPTFPKLPVVFPSINEYKIDRKSSNQHDVKDIYDAKRRKLNFDESLLSIEKIYNHDNFAEENRHQQHERKNGNSRSHYRSSSSTTSHDHHGRNSSSKNGRRRSRSRDRDRRSHHNSSRHIYYNNNNRDQMKHSEAKRLVLPSYKLYDKDLDVKLKIMPFVRIEREEKVDDLVKQYN